MFSGSVTHTSCLSRVQVFTTTPTVTKKTSITLCWQWATEWTPRGRSSGSSRTGGTRHLPEWHQVAHTVAVMKRQTDDMKCYVTPSTPLMFVSPWQLGRELGQQGLHPDGTQPWQPLRHRQPGQLPHHVRRWVWRSGEEKGRTRGLTLTTTHKISIGNVRSSIPKLQQPLQTTATCRFFKKTNTYLNYHIIEKLWIGRVGF